MKSGIDQQLTPALVGPLSPDDSSIHFCRALLLQAFGAKLGPQLQVLCWIEGVSSNGIFCTRILSLWPDGAEIYNPAQVFVGSHAIIYQGAHVCGAELTASITPPFLCSAIRCRSVSMHGYRHAHLSPPGLKLAQVPFWSLRLLQLAISNHGVSMRERPQYKSRQEQISIQEHHLLGLESRRDFCRTMHWNNCEYQMVDNGTVYDRTAATFASHVDSLINTGRYRRGNLFLSSALASVSPNGKVLDYGCGPGRISLLLARRGFRVRGIDPSPEMIAVAKQQFLEGLQIEFQCRPTIADQPTGFFDAVTCSSVIEYVPDPKHLLRECLRVLRYNGVLIISFANRRSVSRALFQHRNLHLVGQKHLWDVHEFRQLLIGSGFQPMGKPRYFDSFCDRLAPLTHISDLQFVGSLGLFVAVNASLMI